MPTRLPGAPTGTIARWRRAETAFALLVSVLAHEVGHAVPARRNDLPGDSVTLRLLGGATSLQGQADSPGAEVRIARDELHAATASNAREGAGYVRGYVEAHLPVRPSRPTREPRSAHPL